MWEANATLQIHRKNGVVFSRALTAASLTVNHGKKYLASGSEK
jgi:hypothetical protein